jgi:rubrerythrin
MDGTAVLAAVREECATELDRLGSEKALVASTAAQLDRERVLAAAAAAEARAHETFTAWADDEGHAAAADAFRDVAATEADHHERVVSLADGAVADTEVDALHDHLRDVAGTPERVAAGLVGRPLVASRSLLQVINFFVNEGETAAAETFRDLRSDTDATVERGAALLDEVCGSDAEYERARAAAVAAVEVAYEAYATDLEALGIDPKPVC